ncbi:unnamed protein product, partial [Owenia fusiformis]
QQWKIIVNCSGRNFYDPTSENFMPRMLGINPRKCMTIFQPTVPTDVRPCLHVLNSCKSKCRNDAVKQQCMKGAYDPQLATFFYVRNTYCIHCNGHNKNCTGKTVEKNSNVLAFFTYSILLKEGPDDSLNIEIAPVARLAGIQTSFNIQNKETRITKCSPPYLYHNGTCVLKDTMVIEVMCLICFINSDCIDDVINLIWKAFDNIFGIVQSKCKGFWCGINNFYVAYINQTLDWETVLEKSEKKLMDTLPKGTFDPSRSHCTFIKVLNGTELQGETTSELSTANATPSIPGLSMANIATTSSIHVLQTAFLIAQVAFGSYCYW